MSFQKVVVKETSSIPVIDFKALTMDGKRVFELEKLQSACRDWGVFQIWSNGLYKSPEHKVTVNEYTRRISIRVFFNPKIEAKIGPADSLINSENPLQFTTVTLDKYLKEFFSKKLAVKTCLEQMRINKF